MHLCFVDESGTPAKPGRANPRHFVMGAVVIPEDQWHSVRLKFIGLKRNFGYRGEVKWRFFAPGNTDADNPMAGWDQAQRNTFRAEIFKVITSFNSVKILACVSECSKAYDLPSVNDQSDLYFSTYKPLTERFQYMLQDLSSSVGSKICGIIIADHRGRGDDEQIRLQHERLVREDGRYTSTYKNFIECLFFSPSHMSVGIQLADMAAGAIWRAFEHNDDTWLNVIRPAIRSSPGGLIDGYGVARFPKRQWTGRVIR